jgi:hypothetical protein
VEERRRVRGGSDFEIIGGTVDAVVLARRVVIG